MPSRSTAHRRITWRRILGTERIPGSKSALSDFAFTWLMRLIIRPLLVVITIVGMALILDQMFLGGALLAALILSTYP